MIIERHEMWLEKTNTSGIEEWYCPLCGYRFLMSWPPNFDKIVLEVGNEHVIHSGSKGGLRIEAQTIDDEEELMVSDELRTAIEEALDGINFD